MEIILLPIASVAAPILVLNSDYVPKTETRFESALANTAYEKESGFNGELLSLYQSPLLAIDWKDTDPEIFPRFSSGLYWAHKKARQIDEVCANARKSGLKVFAQCDLVVLPKRLVDKYQLGGKLGNVSDPTIQSFIRMSFEQVFKRFPDIDGFVIRIGETYMEGAPYHDGRVDRPRDVDGTIVPLINLLEDVICRQGHKVLIFRTWDSFDAAKAYRKVDAAVEPDDLLYFSVKHCNDDFQRTNGINQVIGIGRHKQIIEVQCAREYEGKGAYPNYIANGVIDGFEEDLLSMPSRMIRSIADFQRRSPLFAGVWIWSRGGGWGGPEISNELWPRLNAWVLAQWANHPEKSEESIFMQFAIEQLGLSREDAGRFRRLALLSAAAVLRGEYTAHHVLDGNSPKASMYRVNQPWSRDDTINTPNLPKDPALLVKILKEREEAVNDWSEIVNLSNMIQFPDKATATFVRQSSLYGFDLYQIYDAVFHLKELETGGQTVEIKDWLQRYDAAWEDLRRVCNDPNAPATCYQASGSPKYASGEGVDVLIKNVREIEAGGERTRRK